MGWSRRKEWCKAATDVTQSAAMQARSGIVLAAHTTKTAILISNARTDKGGSETEAYREGQRERERER